MDKIVAEELGVQQDVKALAKENLKALAGYSKRFRFIQVLKYKTRTSSYSFFKRAFDILVGFVGTLCLLPVMLFVKIANLFHGDKKETERTEKK